MIEQAAVQVPALFDQLEAREAAGVPNEEEIDAAIDAARAVDRIAERAGLAPQAA